MAATAMMPRVMSMSKFISSPRSVCRDEIIMRADGGKSIKKLAAMNYFLDGSEKKEEGRCRGKKFFAHPTSHARS